MKFRTSNFQPWNFKHQNLDREISNIKISTLKFHASELQNIFLHKRVGGLGGNAAHIVLVANHQDVSLVSPSHVPRVLDDPVVCALLVSTIAYDQDRVVEFIWYTSFVLVNSCTNKTFIVLELQKSGKGDCGSLTRKIPGFQIWVLNNCFCNTLNVDKTNLFCNQWMVT